MRVLDRNRTRRKVDRLGAPATEATARTPGGFGHLADLGIAHRGYLLGISVEMRKHDRASFLDLCLQNAMGGCVDSDAADCFAGEPE